MLREEIMARSPGLSSVGGKLQPADVSRIVVIVRNERIGNQELSAGKSGHGRNGMIERPSTLRSLLPCRIGADLDRLAQLNAQSLEINLGHSACVERPFGAGSGSASGTNQSSQTDEKSPREQRCHKCSSRS